MLFVDDAPNKLNFETCQISKAKKKRLKESLNDMLFLLPASYAKNLIISR